MLRDFRLLALAASLAAGSAAPAGAWSSAAPPGSGPLAETLLAAGAAIGVGIELPILDPNSPVGSVPFDGLAIEFTGLAEAGVVWPGASPTDGVLTLGDLGSIDWDKWLDALPALELPPGAVAFAGALAEFSISVRGPGVDGARVPEPSAAAVAALALAGFLARRRFAGRSAARR